MTPTLAPLDFEPWRAAKNTLHLWCQIIGKTKLGLTPRRDQPVRPAPAAAWVEQRGGSLAVLAYDDVRRAPDPRTTLLEFIESTYEAGAGPAGWDLDDTRTDWCPIQPTGDHRG